MLRSHGLARGAHLWPWPTRTWHGLTLWLWRVVSAGRDFLPSNHDLGVLQQKGGESTGGKSDNGGFLGHGDSSKRFLS
jgi:hypothetical protein